MSGQQTKRIQFEELFETNSWSVCIVVTTDGSAGARERREKGESFMLDEKRKLNKQQEVALLSVAGFLI